MNIDEILRMAEESGIFEFMDSMNLQAQNNAVIAFANLVAAAERESCARVCDEIDRRWINQAEKCAERIRARGE